MSCTEFEDDLRRYYLGEEDDKPKASEYIKMQTHIRSCTTCSVNSEKLKAMQAAINGIVKQKTSATFYDTLSEKLPKPSPVTIYMNQIKRKFAKVPRPVWIGGFSLVTIFIIFMLVKIFFPSFGLPVIYYYGDVDIRKSTDNSGLKKLSGYPVLSVGDKLKTDSSSSVVFVIAKNTSARMGENTDLRIGLIQRSRDEGYTCKLDVVSGNLWVSQIAGESKFEKEKLQITTDNAFIEPLGADFDISAGDNKTTLRVFKGKVRFYHRNFQDEKSIIDAGHSSLTSADQPPTSPAEIDTQNLGGWEDWNLKIPLTGNLLLIKGGAIDLGKPKSFRPLFATPSPEPEVMPTPTPAGYYQ